MLDIYVLYILDPIRFWNMQQLEDKLSIYSFFPDGIVLLFR